MPPGLGYLRSRIPTRDSSDALLAAGVKAWSKYERTRKSRYLDRAIRKHQAALYIRVSGHPGRPNSLHYTAMALWAQCQRGGVTKENSSIVISYYDEALRLLPLIGEGEHRAIVHNNLGNVYFSLFRLRENNREDFLAGSNLDKAIENHRSALEFWPARNGLNRIDSLINLSVALVQKDHEIDLTQAITYLNEAVELCGAKASSRHLLLLSLDGLANAYDSRFSYSEDINDVVEKINAMRKILDLTGEGKGRLVPLLNLTRALWGLCELEPNRANDLDEAVHHGQEALKLSDHVDKITHVAVLTTLAQVLYTRYTRSNGENMTDLNQAIQYYRDAIDPNSEGDSDPSLYNSLASAIYTYCRKFGEVDGMTVEDAISYYRRASDSCPTDNLLQIKVKNNLGNIYLTRFSESGEEGDLVKGIQSYEDIVQPQSPNRHYTYHTYLLEEAKRVLQDRQKGITDKGIPIISRRGSPTASSKSSNLGSSDESKRSRPSTRQPSICSLF